ncbi:MAG: thiamine pyrophosphate-binding protein [Armatimonadota bacterium]|nr:thiamine pyrophosphate-binding protein [Armatimonadota bacterium]MDR7475855.1 thiamine pyrophosphate-binding protein [Armatimonadota bacterium]
MSQQNSETPRTGAEWLAEYLERSGVEYVFGLCGHTNVAVLAALSRSRVRFVQVRHEQVAAHAADGYARVSGKPGVVLIHLGPGLTNATTGVANASLDCVPIVVLAGDVPSYFSGRHAHQEINLHLDAGQFEIYRPFCKWVFHVDRAGQLPWAVSRAFHLARAGRPGPVLVSVAMDVWCRPVPAGASAEVGEVAPPALDLDVAEQVVGALECAERPLIVAGGGVVASRSSESLAALAEGLEVPVVYTLMGKGALSDSHPLCAGMTGFWGTELANRLLREADVVLALGTRFSETDWSSWDPRHTFMGDRGRLIHIDVEASEFGRNTRTSLGIVADLEQALKTLAAVAAGRKRPARTGIRERIARWKADFQQSLRELQASEALPMRPERILKELREVLPPDGLLVTDVGWNKNGVGQQFPVERPGTFLTPGGLATMGFGPAAALGAKLAARSRPVVALVGDGAFGSQLSVVATAVEEKLSVVWVVMNNRGFGTIAGLEERAFGTTYGTLFWRDGEPYSPDFAGIARACGAEGYTVREAGDFRGLLERALGNGRPAVVDVPTENVPVPTSGYWDILDIFQGAFRE